MNHDDPRDFTMTYSENFPTQLVFQDFDSGETFLSFFYKHLKGYDADTLIIFIDQMVWNLKFKEFRTEHIEEKKIILWKAPDGEKVKNFSEYQNAMEFVLEKGIHRQAHLLSIGGGALSDFSGFVAATLLRGITWSTIPTTLLSMVDASIGGKTGINSKYGKNLIGAFYPPKEVMFFEEFLQTLPLRETESGLGEIIKYGFLDFSIYQKIIAYKNLKTPHEKRIGMLKIIESCARFKSQIVQEDFREVGVRKTLNLGHTFGHGLELIYGMSHGLSVVWGLFLAVKLFSPEDKSEKILNELRVMLQALEFQLGPSPWLNKEFPIDKLMTYLSKDKKSISKLTIDIIVINEVSSVSIERKSFEEISQQLNSLRDELKKWTL